MDSAYAVYSRGDWACGMGERLLPPRCPAAKVYFPEIPSARHLCLHNLSGREGGCAPAAKKYPDAHRWRVHGSHIIVISILRMCDSVGATRHDPWIVLLCPRSSLVETHHVSMYSYCSTRFSFDLFGSSSIWIRGNFL